MDERAEGSPVLACVADQSASAAALLEGLAVLFPESAVTRVDIGVERTLPPRVDCVIIDATVRGQHGLDVLRRYRAGGYAGAAVLIVNGAHPDSGGDAASVARLGGRACALAEGYPVTLGAAIADALRIYDDGGDGTPSAQALRALRQAEQLMAAGELAMNMRHSLNNPLAALLAEAQLLEFEPLSPDHEASVQRIIALTRRVIEVVRTLDGVGKP